MAGHLLVPLLVRFAFDGSNRSNSTDDFLVDYRECPPTPGKAARLVIVGAPKGITPGVAEFTVFGEAAKR